MLLPLVNTSTMVKDKRKTHGKELRRKMEEDVNSISMTLQKSTVGPAIPSEHKAPEPSGTPRQRSTKTFLLSDSLTEQTNQTEDLDCIEVQSTETKGKAVFAIRKIKAGTLLLRETPLIRLTQSEEDQDTSSEGDASVLEDRFNQLPKATQKAYLKLYDSQKSGFSRVKSIYYSNCYNLSNANRPSKASLCGSVIGIMASRINHSCVPNVQFSFDEVTNEMLFHAIRPIPRGKEIVSNYNSVFDMRAARQRKQMLYYGFECDCEACQAKTEFWTKSDERRRGMIEARKEIKRCDKAFEEHGKVHVDSDPLYALERLELLMVKEGLFGLPLADVYRSLGKWAERKSDVKAVMRWKIKELDVCKICFGEQSPRVKLLEAKTETFR